MKKLSLLVFALFLILSACGEKEYTARAIKADDTCAVCNMAVADDKFATQIVLENQEVFTFDDIGCLHKWTTMNSDKKIGASFIRDFETEEWFNMKDGTFVYSKEIKTPMAYGVLSFKNKTAAEEYAKEYNAEVLNYEQLKDHEWKQMKMHKKM